MHNWWHYNLLYLMLLWFALLSVWTQCPFYGLCPLPGLAAPWELLSQSLRACRGLGHCLWCSGRRRRWMEAGGFWLSPPPLASPSFPTPPGSPALHAGHTSLELKTSGRRGERYLRLSTYFAMKWKVLWKDYLSITDLKISVKLIEPTWYLTNIIG